MGSSLELVLITALDSQFTFSETIRVLGEGGAEVVGAAFTVLDHAVFHSIRSKIALAGAGLEHCGAARIRERLKKFVQAAAC